MVLGFLLAAALSFADFLSASIRLHARKAQLVSFAAGVSISYIFLILLPEVYTFEIAHHDKYLFLATLFGFSIFHIADKYVHEKYKGIKYKNVHHMLHANMSFLNMFIVGFLLVRFAQNSMSEGLALFIPILFHVIIDTLPHRINKHVLNRFFYSVAPLFGALLAFFTNTGRVVNIILLSFVGGAILYTVIREDLPEGGKGRVYFFIMGTVFFIAIAFIFWQFI